MDWKLFDRIVLVFGLFLMRVRVCVYVCRVEGVVVDYSVAMLVSDAGVSNVQQDYLTLQANRVENFYHHHHVEEMLTLVPTFSPVRTHGGKALQEMDAQSGETHACF